MTDTVNADLSESAILNINEIEWQQSPSPTVWRKRLYSLGGEKSAVTSVVRYDAGADFPPHDHPGGEEIFVLGGTLSDEAGDYAAGTYILNPEGFHHRPFSREGALILVRLWQYHGAGRTRTIVDSNAAPWLDGPEVGIEIKPLYHQEGFPERVRLEYWLPDYLFPERRYEAVSEFFILNGAFEDESGRHEAGTWLRFAAGAAHHPVAPEGCVLLARYTA